MTAKPNTAPIDRPAVELPGEKILKAKPKAKPPVGRRGKRTSTGRRGTGRTLGLALQAIGKAVQNPGQTFKFVDHTSESKSSYLVSVLEYLIDSMELLIEVDEGLGGRIYLRSTYAPSFDEQDERPIPYLKKRTPLRGQKRKPKKTAVKTPADEDKDSLPFVPVADDDWPDPAPIPSLGSVPRKKKRTPTKVKKGSATRPGKKSVRGRKKKQ